MKKIKINRSLYLLIDNKDFKKIKLFHWYAAKKFTDKTFYVVRHYYTIDGKRNNQGIHRFLLNITDPNILVDHINGNGLDNRRCNLRIVTKSENQKNRGNNKNNTSGYKGVSYHKLKKKYISVIGFNGKKIFLGYFKNPKQASKVYNKKAKELFGKFYRKVV